MELKKNKSCKFQEYPFLKYLDRGSYGEVYRISDTHVAKVEKFHDINSLEEEFDIAKELYEKGISVPKPEGIFPVGMSKTKMQGFVMEYIYGKTFDEVYQRDEELFYQVKKLREKEINKVKDLGFYPKDFLNNKNNIWQPDEEKVYLIDFGRWERR